MPSTPAWALTLHLCKDDCLTLSHSMALSLTSLGKRRKWKKKRREREEKEEKRKKRERDGRGTIWKSWKFKIDDWQDTKCKINKLY